MICPGKTQGFDQGEVERTFHRRHSALTQAEERKSKNVHVQSHSAFDHDMGFMLGGTETCIWKEGLEPHCEGDKAVAETSVGGH